MLTFGQMMLRASTQMMLCPADTNEKIHRDCDGFFGAATQIRTGDLILTKDVLYQLSHSSVNRWYYSRENRFCQALKSKKTKIFSKYGTCAEKSQKNCHIPSRLSTFRMRAEDLTGALFFVIIKISYCLAKTKTKRRQLWHILTLTTKKKKRWSSHASQRTGHCGSTFFLAF